MKQATASCLKFSKELTKYDVSVAIHTQKLDIFFVHAEESWICQKKCFLQKTNILSNSLKTPTWHSKGRAESSMVLSRGRSIILMNYVMILFHMESIFFTWVDLEINTPVQKPDWWQEDKNVKKEGKRSSSLLLISVEHQCRRNSITPGVRKLSLNCLFAGRNNI